MGGNDTRIRKPALQQRRDDVRLLDRCQMSALLEHLKARAGYAVAHPLVLSEWSRRILAAARNQRRYSHCSQVRVGIGAREHRLLLVELTTVTDAARHASHQAAHTGSIRRVHPARRQLRDQGIDPPGLHLRNVGEATLPHSLCIGNGTRIEQHEPFDALELPSDYLEREIAAQRQAYQREPRRRTGKQLDGHPAERGVLAKRKHVAVIQLTQRIDLVGEQAFVREMCACERECRFGLHSRLASADDTLAAVDLQGLDQLRDRGHAAALHRHNLGKTLLEPEARHRPLQGVGAGRIH